MTERLYLSDPFLFEFEATVSRKLDLNGTIGLVLDRTCFYPTGGGQEHDTGTLDGAQVTDVYTDDEGNLIHILDRDVPETAVAGRVDSRRRLASMQHHSAQHLTSAIIARLYGLETLSSHISIDTPTTIDVPGSLSEAELSRVEDEVNSVVRSDRAIRSYSITDAKVSKIPFRRPPKVSGEIRVVEIEGIDYSACGGTHCTRTGMLGVVKILRIERRGEKSRIHFVAGESALANYRLCFDIVSAAARRLDTHPEGILERVVQQSEQLHAAQKELDALREEKLGWDAKELAAGGEVMGPFRVVRKIYRDRSPQEVRGLARLLQDAEGVIAFLATFDGARFILTVTCAPETGVDANELVRRLMREIGGRGGGDARLAQGGAAAAEEQLVAFLESAPSRIRSPLLSGTPPA